MGAHGLADLEGDGLQRVQGRGRLLEDGADEPPAHVVEHRAGGAHEFDGADDVGALPVSLAGPIRLAGPGGVDDARRTGDGGGGGQQPQGAQGGHRLAGAGLAHEGLDTAGPQVQVDPGGGGRAASGEGDAEAAQAQRRPADAVGPGPPTHEALTPITW